MPASPPPPVHPSESEGARLFVKHLADNGWSCKPFCHAANLPHYQVMRLLNGKTRDMTLRLAADIGKATGGNVPPLTWLHRPRRKASD